MSCHVILARKFRIENFKVLVFKTKIWLRLFIGFSVQTCSFIEKESGYEMSSDTGLYFAQFPTNFDKLQAVLVEINNDGHIGEESTQSWPGPRQFYR